MGTEFARKLTDEEAQGADQSIRPNTTASAASSCGSSSRQGVAGGGLRLYQRLPGDTYLFNGDSDVVYYRTSCRGVAESTYPESPYLQSLQAEIARMDARISLTSQITEARHPDLERRTSTGKKSVFRRSRERSCCWISGPRSWGRQRAERRSEGELYKYADAPVGFEVYQVAVDTSKPLWITAVQEQQLPWISVSDLRGRFVLGAGLYNVQRLPGQLPDRQGGDDRGQEHLRQEPRSETGRADKIESCIISHPTSTWGRRPRLHGRSKRRFVAWLDDAAGCGGDLSGRGHLRFLVRIPPCGPQGLRADAGQAGRTDRPGRAGGLLHGQTTTCGSATIWRASAGWRSTPRPR